MILAWLIIILLAAGVSAAIAARWSADLSRWISLAATVLDLALILTVWIRHAGRITLGGSSPWLEQLDWTWIPQFGIHLHLAVDGLSLLLLALTFFLGVLSVLCSWTEITESVGFFHLNLMWILAGITGVFLALDLFLFYFFWELMLVPMYFLIALWGHERRIYAAIKFFLFTQLSGLLMLVAILALYFFHQQSTGTYTFDYEQLLRTPLSPQAGLWIMLGFFAAFAVKLPLFPLHTWLPDAHTEAPTAGSVILAGLLLKTGAYGLIRFVVPLFPEAAREFAPVAMVLGAIGIIYGAVLAFAQSDLKRLVAYTSVSHLGFVVLGVFSWNELALQGAVMTMLCHGVSTGALFILTGALQERIHTRELGRMGGLWTTAPRLSGAGLYFALASLGLPGLGDFIGEFLVLLGAYRAHPILAIVGAIGVLAATFYALRLVQRAFLGPNENAWAISDLVPREVVTIFLMVASLLWLGLYPRPVLSTFHQSLDALEAATQTYR
jgi:NADH-quinone oxidoreductase subunit M